MPSRLIPWITTGPSSGNSNHPTIGIRADQATFPSDLTIDMYPSSSATQLSQLHPQLPPLLDTDKINFIDKVTANHIIFHGPVTIIPGSKIPRPAIYFNVQDPVESFTGREDILEQLKDSLLDSKLHEPSYQVIGGPGGLGKTETVRQFIANQKDYFDNVIWINAENESSITDSFLSLARSHHLTIKSQNIDDKSKTVDEIIAEVYSRIFRAKSLLVFDNVPNFSGKKSSGFRIKKFLPSCIPPEMIPPAILITSRRIQWKFPVIQLPHFQPNQSVEFIRKKLNHQNSNTFQVEAEELGRIFDHFPLVLEQAVAYIKHIPHSTPSSSIQSYIDTFKNPGEQLNCLNWTVPPLESPYPLTLHTAMTLTLSTIQKSPNGQEALELIQLLSFLNSSSVPSTLLWAGFTKDDANQETQLVQFNQSLKLLADFALIKLSIDQEIDQECKYISTHPLVQSIVRDQLKKSTNQNLSPSVIIPKYRKFLDTLQPSESTFSSVLRSLLKIIDNYTPPNENNVDHLQLAQFTRYLASKFIIDGKYALSAQLLIPSIATLQSQFGPSHSETIESQAFLFDVLFNETNYDAALELIQSMYCHLLDSVGLRHQLTLRSLYGMSRVYLFQRKFEEALEIRERAEKIVSGKPPPQSILDEKEDENAILWVLTLIRMNTANILNEQGRYMEALQLYDQIQRGHDGPLDMNDRENYLCNLTNMVHLYFQIRRYSGALAIARNVWELRMKDYGEGNPKTILALAILAQALGHQGQNEEALKLAQESYERMEKVMGKSHPETLIILDILAGILWSQGHAEEALRINQSVCSVRLELWGQDHPTVIASQFHTALALLKRGDFKGAYDLLANFGLDNKTKSKDPQILAAVSLKSFIMYENGQCTEALVLARQVLEQQREYFGPSHLTTMRTWRTIADMLWRNSESREAHGMFQEIHLVQKETLGEEHQETLSTLHAIAMTLVDDQEGIVEEKRNEMFEEAIGILRDLCERRKMLGQKHPSTAMILHSLGCTFQKWGNYKEAWNYFKEACPILERNFGAGHPHMMKMVGNMAEVAWAVGEFEEALHLNEKVLRAQIESGLEEKKIIKSQIYIANCLTELGKLDEAQQIYLDNYKKLITSHPEQNGLLMEVQQRISFIIKHQDNDESTLEQLQMILKVMEEVHGEGDESTWPVMRDIAVMLFNLKRIEEAFKMADNCRTLILSKGVNKDDPALQSMNSVWMTAILAQDRPDEGRLVKVLEILEGRKEVLGQPHLETLEIQLKLGLVWYAKLNRFDTARELFEGIKYNLIGSVGGGKAELLSLAAEHGIASILNIQGHHERALELAVKVYRERARILGLSHEFTVAAFFLIRDVLEGTQGEEKVLDIFKVIYEQLDKDEDGAESAVAMLVLENIARVQDSLGNYVEVLGCLEKIHAFRLRILGEKHEGTILAGKNMEEIKKKILEVNGQNNVREDRTAWRFCVIL